MSEATVYRLLKAHDLITSPAYVVIKASGCDRATVLHKPRLLSDNGLCWEATAATGQQVSLRRELRQTS